MRILDASLLVAIALLTDGGCASTPGSSQRKLAPGEFQLTRLEGSAAGRVRYLASGGGSCNFEVWIETAKPISGASFSFAKASLVRHQSSDCTAYLSALAKRLAYAEALPRPERADKVPATMAILGMNQSRHPGGENQGSFWSTPPGNWMATKLFLADGEGEVFLNLNEREGYGEFSIKDEDYASTVATELAKVML